MMNAKLGNKVKEQIGINKVRNVVQNLWCCGWQQYGAENDDAVDGVILMRRGEKNPIDTGGVVYVQSNVVVMGTGRIKNNTRTILE